LDIKYYNMIEKHRTCMACPSQWEGKLDDGRMFYMRYRHSHFSFEVSLKPTDDVYDAIDGELVVHVTTDEDDGGWMTDGEALELLKENGVILVDSKE